MDSYLQEEEKVTDGRTVFSNNSNFILLPLTSTKSPLIYLLYAEASAVCSAAAVHFLSQIVDSHYFLKTLKSETLQQLDYLNDMTAMFSDRSHYSWVNGGYVLEATFKEMIG